MMCAAFSGKSNAFTEETKREKSIRIKYMEMKKFQIGEAERKRLLASKQKNIKRH